MMSKRIKISVAVITYNQEKTIKQTLDSILIQKGNFDLEVVIGEDCSKDNTWNICKQYADQYPNVINLLPNTHNLGITANYFRVLKACTGQYVADIAGDDYYIDDHAFVKQIIYFEQHPSVGVLAPNGYRYYVRRNKMILGENELTRTTKAKDFYFNHDYRGGVIIQGGGLMFRRDLLKHIDYDEIVRRKLPVEDYPIQAIWSQYTNFAWLQDPIVVYRVYGKSSTFVPLSHPKYLSYHKGLMDTRRYLNELFPQDACFSEMELRDYEFYVEFLLYLHKLQYSKAISLIQEIVNLRTAHYAQARRMTKTRVHFVLFHAYKEIRYIIDKIKRT